MDIFRDAPSSIQLMSWKDRNTFVDLYRAGTHPNFYHSRFGLSNLERDWMFENIDQVEKAVKKYFVDRQKYFDNRVQETVAGNEAARIAGVRQDFTCPGETDVIIEDEEELLRYSYLRSVQWIAQHLGISIENAEREIERVQCKIGKNMR